MRFLDWIFARGHIEPEAPDAEMIREARELRAEADAVAELIRRMDRHAMRRADDAAS